MNSKEEIRKLVRGYRASLSREEAAMKSIVILEKLFHTKEYEQAKIVYCYLDIQNEVATKPLLRRAWSEGKRVAVPKVKGTDMEFYYIQSYDDVKQGTFGILEPETCLLAEDNGALLVMPGVAFDKKNHRIGYGGGYYDRYLQRPNQHYKIALAYQFQVFDTVPYEDFDICPDLVLTES